MFKIFKPQLKGTLFAPLWFIVLRSTSFCLIFLNESYLIIANFNLKIVMEDTKQLQKQNILQKNYTIFIIKTTELEIS
jgi:hypothetical protein